MKDKRNAERRTPHISSFLLNNREDETNKTEAGVAFPRPWADITHVFRINTAHTDIAEFPFLLGGPMDQEPNGIRTREKEQVEGVVLWKIFC